LSAIPTDFFIIQGGPHFGENFSAFFQFSSKRIMTPSTALASLPQFTCIACQIGFHSADQQREHYHTDWHRYNLKRKVVSLPPVSAENFAQRLQTQRDEARVQEQESQQANECTVCGKSYNSRNALDNHFVSRKHKETVAKLKSSAVPAKETAPQQEHPTVVRNKPDIHENDEEYVMVQEDESEATITEIPGKNESQRAKDIQRRLLEAQTEASTQNLFYFSCDNSLNNVG
jgi:pre-60S factor REI1